MPTRRPSPKPVALTPAPAVEESLPAPALVPLPALPDGSVPARAPAPPPTTTATEPAPPAPAAGRVGGSTAPPGVSLALRTPTRLPKASSPVALAVEAKLSNTGSLDALLSAPTPCDVTAWEITDRAGRIILAKESAICTQVIAESVLRPGEILVARDVIQVPGDSLTGGKYRLRYAFWGAVAESEITVQ